MANLPGFDNEGALCVIDIITLLCYAVIES